MNLFISPDYFFVKNFKLKIIDSIGKFTFARSGDTCY